MATIKKLIVLCSLRLRFLEQYWLYCIGFQSGFLMQCWPASHWWISVGWGMNDTRSNAWPLLGPSCHRRGEITFSFPLNFGWVSAQCLSESTQVIWSCILSKCLRNLVPPNVGWVDYKCGAVGLGLPSEHALPQRRLHISSTILTSENKCLYFLNWLHHYLSDLLV